jgi:hypothetical protein
MKGICGFCGVYGEQSKEHYIAQRFRNLFPIKIVDSYGQRLTVYNPATHAYDPVLERPSRSPWGLTVRVGQYCCNGAWMARLDDVVAPFLNGALTTEPRHVSPSLLSALAGWTAKVAALHDLSTGRPTAMTPDDRRHIKRHGRPPLSSTVWLTAAEWNPNILPSIDQTTFWWPVGGKRPARTEPDSFSATIYFAHVVIHAFGTAMPKLLNPRGEVGERLIRIWPSPPAAGLTWPGAAPLTYTEAGALARSVEAHFTGRVAPIH